MAQTSEEGLKTISTKKYTNYAQIKTKDRIAWKEYAEKYNKRKKELIHAEKMDL